MKTLLPLTLLTLLLSGCPDSKLPKVPPSVPEPKAATSSLYSPSDLPAQHRSFHLMAA